jgi:hypothetical protein
MKDLRREILNQVASGAISAEEGAARLESLEEPAHGAVSTAAPPTAQAPAIGPGTAIRRIKVVSQFGAAEIVADPSVASAVAEGPHRARQDGDTMVIEHQPFEESDSFTFGHGPERRFVVDGLNWQRRKLTVRMNPNLELSTTVQAGNVFVTDVKGPINVEVQAGNCRIAGFRGPLSASVQAGNVMASGRLDQGASKVRCEMGSVKVALEKGSSVRITARTQMGKIAIEGPGGAPAVDGGGKEVKVGAGEATLDIECMMGSVKVSAD